MDAEPQDAQPEDPQAYTKHWVSYTKVGLKHSFCLFCFLGGLFLVFWVFVCLLLFICFLFIFFFF